MSDLVKVFNDYGICQGNLDTSIPNIDPLLHAAFMSDHLSKIIHVENQNLISHV